MEGDDGTIGWTNTPLRENTGGELALQQEFAEFPAGLKFRESHQKVLVDAKDKVGDRDVYRVVGTRGDGWLSTFSTLMRRPDCFCDRIPPCRAFSADFLKKPTTMIIAMLRASRFRLRCGY